MRVDTFNDEQQESKANPFCHLKAASPRLTLTFAVVTMRASLNHEDGPLP